MQTAKEILDLLSGALTPLVAVIVAYIAYQQYRIQRLQFRHDSYERRLTVFKAVRSFAAGIVREGRVDYPTSQSSTRMPRRLFLFSGMRLETT